VQHIMHADYAAWVAAEGLTINERIRRSTTVPHLFTEADKRELFKELAERGLVWDGGSTLSHDRNDPWYQLKVGVVLISQTIQFRATKGRRYRVVVTRKPEAPETWHLIYDCKVLAQGEDRATLWAAMDARTQLRRAAP